MASTLQTFDFAIKDRYNQKKVENLTLADRPLLAMLRKSEDFMGEATHVPLIYGNPQGLAGVSLAQAQTSASNVQGSKFLLTVGDYNGSVSIGDKVIEASRGNPGAFLKNKVQEIDGLYEQMADVLATYSYGNSGNSIGRVASVSVAGGSQGGDLITLTEPTQIINFEVNMVISADVTDGTDTGQSADHENLTVVAVDRENGIVDVGTAATSITANDYLFRQGDFRGNTGTFVFHGLSDFIWPDNAPPVIYSMTRTADPQRLAGCRVAANELVGKDIEERLRLLGTQMTGRYKGPGASHVFMNPEDWDELVTSLSSRGYRTFKDESTRFGFEAIEFVAGGVKLKIYADRYCPRKTVFALRLKDWTMHSMRKLIHPIEADGLTLLRASTANDYEYRLVSYPALCTVAPGYSGRVSLA